MIHLTDANEELSAREFLRHLRVRHYRGRPSTKECHISGKDLKPSIIPTGNPVELEDVSAGVGVAS